MNQTTDEMPLFDHLQQLLSSIELVVGVSEIHGVITGLLCAGNLKALAVWFEDLFKERSSEDLLVRETRQLLGQAFSATRNQINHDDLEFSLYLPSDSLSLQERAKCLSDWCQGFLYGLGLAGVEDNSLSVNAREVIADISEMTKLDYENIEPDEVSEVAYTELQEFLRVATLLIWEELSAVREAADESK